MDNYTIYCTEEQTKKALELGAPIEMDSHSHGQPYIQDKTNFFICPTAEQMIGWLEEENGFEFYIMKDVYWYADVTHGHNWYFTKDRCSSRPDATLAAIDAALEYLINKK